MHSYVELIETVKMDFLALLTVFALIFGASIGSRLDPLADNSVEERIMGGNAVRRGEFPYMVSLRSNRPYNNSVAGLNHCGGSLISNRWIISAAQCTKRHTKSTLVVVVGAHHYYNDGKMYKLSQIVNHPTYNLKNRRNDLTLLQTIETIQFNEFVKPIALNKKVVGAGLEAKFTGWGAIWYNGQGHQVLQN